MQEARRAQRMLDVAQLLDASEAVEELRASLAVSAAVEEAARLEVEGLRAQLDQYHAEEELRFSSGLKAQADLMKLQERSLDLMHQVSELRTAAGAAEETTRSLQAEVTRRDGEVAVLRRELSATRAHAATVIVSYRVLSRGTVSDTVWRR